MAGGIDTQHGINYQNYVGVLRVLEFLSKTDLQSIEFESIDENQEDINIEYDDYLIFEQVKKRENSVWTKSALKLILGKFIEKFTSLKFQKAVKFRFTTSAGWNSDISKLMDIQGKLRGSDKLTNKETSTLAEFFGTKYKIGTIKEILGKIEFVWNYHAANHPSTPFNVIIDACKSTLSEHSIVKGGYEELINKIIVQIMEFSSSKIRKKYTAVDFELVSGIPAYTDEYEYINTKLGPNYLSVIKKYNPRLVRKDFKQMLYGMKFTVPIYLEINNHAIALWLIDMNMTAEDFNRINHYIKNVSEIDHFVLSLETNSDYDRSTFHFDKDLLINDSIKLQAKLEAISYDRINA